MPKVSVVIPTYNREKYVINAIESVLAQTFRDYEIMVVDDGSTDNTGNRVKEYRDKVKYIYQENAGVSAARNTGIKMAAGEWLAFLDSDDEWMPGYLSRQIEKVNMNPNICMQTTDSCFIGLNGDTQRYFEMNGSLPEFHGKDYLLLKEPFGFVIKHGPWQIGSTIILREATKNAGLFDTGLRISEDFDLMARVALQGPFGMIDEVLVKIFRRDESVQCLTSQAKKDPIGARESGERIYERLKAIQTLRDKEIKALNELSSANRRAMGNLLLENGRIGEARNCYKRAFLIYPSIASLGKYVLSFLPSEINLWTIKKNGAPNRKKRICRQ